MNALPSKLQKIQALECGEGLWTHKIFFEKKLGKHLPTNWDNIEDPAKEVIPHHLTEDQVVEYIKALQKTLPKKCFQVSEQSDVFVALDSFSQGIYSESDASENIRDEFGTQTEALFENFNKEALKFFRFIVKIEYIVDQNKRGLGGVKLASKVEFNEFLHQYVKTFHAYRRFYTAVAKVKK